MGTDRNKNSESIAHTCSNTLSPTAAKIRGSKILEVSPLKLYKNEKC